MPVAEHRAYSQSYRGLFQAPQEGRGNHAGDLDYPLSIDLLRFASHSDLFGPNYLQLDRFGFICCRSKVPQFMARLPRCQAIELGQSENANEGLLVRFCRTIATVAFLCVRDPVRAGYVLERERVVGNQEVEG